MNSNELVNQNPNKPYKITFKLLFIIILYAIFHLLCCEGGSLSTQHTQQEVLLMLRSDYEDRFRTIIDSYVLYKKKFPKKLDDLLSRDQSAFFEKIPADPLTGKVDWEVCDYKNKDVWYRTSDIDYEPHLQIWNPGPENGIYAVRGKGEVRH